MRRSLIFWMMLAVAMLRANTTKIDFENEPLAHAPKGWVCHSQWKVQADPSAPSGTHVLTMVRGSTGFLGFGRVFNTCYDPKLHFLDGTISVRFRALRGRIDQGGGIMWRVRDADNYYIVRYNPLENNFTFYKVVAGERIELADREGLHLSPGWHEMSISQHGALFTGFLDGKKILEKRDDSFPTAGAVGLWTKTDAVTSFDDLQIDTQ